MPTKAQLQQELNECREQIQDERYVRGKHTEMYRRIAADMIQAKSEMIKELLAELEQSEHEIKLKDSKYFVVQDNKILLK